MSGLLWYSPVCTWETRKGEKIDGETVDGCGMDVVTIYTCKTKRNGTGEEERARDSKWTCKVCGEMFNTPGRCQGGIIITSCVHMGSTTHWKFGNMARVAHCVDHLKTVQPVLVFCAGSAAQARVSFALLG